MTPYRRNAGFAFTINIQLLYASAFAAGSWLAWPETPEWWGMGVVSILLGMGAVAGAGGAIGAIVARYRRDRAIADYMAQGGAPKSARLANEEQLRQAGMLE